MAIFRNIIILAAIATTSAAYADSYSDYQQQRDIQDQIENQRISQSIDMQNMQNQMNSYQAPQTPPAPQVEYQSQTRDTMYGTMYVGQGYAR